MTPETVVVTQGVDWTAITGIIGTLLGVAIGAFSAYKIQERQLRHADESLFHKERFKVYSTVMKSGKLAVSHWGIGSTDNDSIDRFLFEYERLGLIGTERVLVEANNLHGEFMVLFNAVARSEQLNKSSFDGFKNALVGFTIAARKELKTIKK